MRGDHWNRIKETLRSQLHPVYLEVDGYLVRLMLDRVGDMKLGITVYVDGWFKGAWLAKDRDTGEWPEIGRRFFQLRERSMYSPQEVRKAERQIGKRRTKKLGLYGKYCYRMPYWQSAESLRRHFIRENSEIRWLTDAEYKAAINAASGLETEAP